MQIKCQVLSAKKTLTQVPNPENPDEDRDVPACEVDFEIMDGEGTICGADDPFCVIFTDPDQLDRFKPGEVYAIGLTRVEAGPFGE